MTEEYDRPYVSLGETRERQGGSWNEGENQAVCDLADLSLHLERAVKTGRQFMRGAFLQGLLSIGMQFQKNPITNLELSFGAARISLLFHSVLGFVTDTKLSKNALTREQSAEVSKEKGNKAYKDKEYQKAIGFYSEAIKLCGNNATYYSNRAAAYLEIGSFVQAEADCSQAINLDKKNVKAYFRRGTAREVLGYYKEAIEDFKYAHVLEPTNKRAAAAADRLRKLFLQ